MSNSELYIGPLRYTYTVQKIQMQDKKSVELLETTRSNKNFIIDSGDSEYKAQIRLLFTGLNEINKGIGQFEEEEAGLRGLIALFRCCPIVSIRNKTISAAWKKADSLYEEDFVTEQSKSRFYSDIIPVALDQISLENVPDIPNSIQVTLNISRVDVAPVTENEILLYSGYEPGSKFEHPRDAYWLKKWINQILSNDTVPKVTERDFKSLSFTYYGKDSIGLDVLNTEYIEKIVVHLDTTDTDTSTICMAESCSIKNKFAYTTLQGANFPYAVHMGSTSRLVSLDLVFNNQKTDYEYKKFCRFKEISDEIIKSKNRIDRVTGWSLESPISKLLHISRTIANILGDKPTAGVFVPVFINNETSDTPDMINTRIDMLENNLDFYEDNEVTLIEGGTDYVELKTFLSNTFKQELNFRRKINKNKDSALKDIVGESPDNSYKSYKLFWPVNKNITDLKQDAPLGILNLDTIRAAFLYNSPKLKSALLDSPLATGKVVANRKITISDKISSSLGFAWKLISGLDETSPEISSIYAEVKAIVESNFMDMSSLSVDDRESFITNVSRLITIGLLGNIVGGAFGQTTAMGEVINTIAKSNLPFTPVFFESLFLVITEREELDSDLPYVYSMDGIYSAFYKLITVFTLEKDASIDIDSSRKEFREKIKKSNNLQSVYPDILLPTYTDLYGPELWRSFAPTIEDLGIDVFEEITGNTEDVLAVQEDDFVSPAAWFYIHRSKQGTLGLKSIANQAGDALNAVSNELSISMPFNTEEVEELKMAQKSSAWGADTGTSGKRTNSTLHNTLKKLLLKYKKKNEKKFREDVINVLSASEGYEEKFLKGEGSIKVYLHHNGNRAIPKRLNIPGVGAEIFKIITEEKELFAKDLPRLDADEVLTTFDGDIRYHRHINENTKKTINASINQLPDDHNSPERLFPAAKVYLIERRGNDIVADDTLFSVNAVVSVDITKDKQDADLAVIRLADPLYSLQKDYFYNNNVIKGNDTKNSLILNTLKEDVGTLKRYKIIQGRSIQIRMGYSSMAYNLPIVFTGRITEIIPGDELTIVAQGWKAELINRKVNFTNKDPKNWGARDLAVQAITYANPQGFGDYFSEFDSRFILDNINKQNVADAIKQSISNTESISLEGRGTQSYIDSINNNIGRFIGLRSKDKQNYGFDTRLKNIWYPDTKLFNNIFGLRTKTGTMPSWTNDSWIVPLQSSWDVLQEAARHAWNCIVDVVPYDAEATIFMGHPDQPYFYTKGNSLSRAYYNKYKYTRDKSYNDVMLQLIDSFMLSKYFNKMPYMSTVEAYLKEISRLYSERGSFFSSIPRNEIGSKISRLEDKIDITYFVSLKEYNYIRTEYNLYPTTTEGMYKNLSKSGIPVAMLEQFKDRGFYSNAITVLFSTFYGIDIEYLKIRWPNLEADMIEILSRQSDYTQFTPDINNKFDSLPTRSLFNSSFISYLKSQIELFESYERASIASGKGPGLGSKIITLSDVFKRALAETSELNNKNLIDYLTLKYNELLVLENEDIVYQTDYGELTVKGNSRLSDYRFILYNLRDILQRLNDANTDTLFSNERNILHELGVDVKGDLRSIVVDNLLLFKAFVYFFSVFALQDPETSNVLEEVKQDDAKILPPTLRVFRNHHYVNTVHNIIKNNIVATTREMWNTVVIEHPDTGDAERAVPSFDSIYSQGRINAGCNWVYYPKQEVTGVIGLQFHPGLTLDNKKVKVFTELNCQTTDLAAKLACGHLAEGIRKMYRGNLIMLGKNMKPHDRILISDSYVNMKGPVEIESLVHHWNTEQGWITNIVPNAVCDANPGAGILQTACLEAIYEGVHNTLDFVSDALTVAAIVATAGAATPLAVGSFSLRGAAGVIAKRFITKGGIKEGLKRTLRAPLVGTRFLARKLGRDAKNIFKKGKTKDSLFEIIRSVSGPAVSIIKNNMYIMGAQFANHTLFKMHVISGFVGSSKDVEQLPVILSPLIFEGNPFTAGLETDDAIWAISGFGLFYSAREMQIFAQRFLEDLGEI